MATINLTSTDVSGFLYSDYTQIKTLLNGATLSLTELNKLDGFNGTYLDLNYAKSLRVMNVSNVEFGCLDGVTSNIQTQLNAKGDMSDLIDDTTPELGGELDAGAHSIGFTMQTATGDGTTTINWKLGNKFKFTFGAQNETFTFTAPSNPCSLTLILVQDGTGSRTATFPATVKWAGGTAPTLTTTGNAVDIVSLLWDGTNYYAAAGLDFS